MKSGALGRVYRDGEMIVRQGELGDCLYVIQVGRVEVFHLKGIKEVRLAVLGKQDFFGEVPLFERRARFSSVRALGDVRVLTVDRKTLLRRIQEDPSLAYRILQTMSQRISVLDAKVTQMKVRGGIDESGVRIVSPPSDLMLDAPKQPPQDKRHA